MGERAADGSGTVGVAGFGEIDPIGLHLLGEAAGTAEATRADLMAGQYTGQETDIEELQVAAEEFGIAGVEIGNEKEGDAEDDEGDVAVGAVEPPDVEQADLGDAEEQKGESGEAEAAFADDEREEEGHNGLHAPGDGDATKGGFIKDEDGDEKKRKEEKDLFGAGSQTGGGEAKFAGRGLSARCGEALAERKGEKLGCEKNRGDGADVEAALEAPIRRAGMQAGGELERERTEKDEEGDDEAVREEELERRSPGDGEKEDGKRRPGDEDPAVMIVGVREEEQRGGTKIREGGGGAELLAKGKIGGGRFIGDKARESDVDVIENESDGQRIGEQLRGARVLITARADAAQVYAAPATGASANSPLAAQRAQR